MFSFNILAIWKKVLILNVVLYLLISPISSKTYIKPTIQIPTLAQSGQEKH